MSSPTHSGCGLWVLARCEIGNTQGNGGPNPISFRFEELQWQGEPALASAKGCHIRSVWDAGKEVGVYDDGYSTGVNGGSAFFAVISACSVSSTT